MVSVTSTQEEFSLDPTVFLSSLIQGYPDIVLAANGMLGKVELDSDEFADTLVGLYRTWASTSSLQTLTEVVMNGAVRTSDVAGLRSDISTAYWLNKAWVKMIEKTVKEDTERVDDGVLKSYEVASRLLPQIRSLSVTPGDETSFRVVADVYEKLTELKYFAMIQFVYSDFNETGLSDETKNSISASSAHQRNE